MSDRQSTISNFYGGPHLQRLLPICFVTIVWLWMFWPMISGQTVCAFRDSGYLYYPMFQFIQQQMIAGELPLWSPYDGNGIPLLADGSSSVFYPGKAIFLLEGLPYPALYGTYLAFHVWLACVGAYGLARLLGADRPGSTLSAFAYGFGGPVLFQLSNVIYLVGAAWLPFALFCVWKMLHSSSKSTAAMWATYVGAICALMVLGGDPQMAYHVGIVTGFTALCRVSRIRFRMLRASWSQTISRARRQTVNRIGLRWLGIRIVLMMCMVVVGFTLAAVQVMPTWVANQRSARDQSSGPATLYGYLAQHFSPVSSGDTRRVELSELIAPPKPGHGDHVYQFSQPPWTIAEFIWPNVSGDRFPTNTRWIDGLPGADRMWHASLYCGLITLFLAISGATNRNPQSRWMLWMTIWFVFASFGWYGCGWLAGEFFPNLGLKVGPQVGGFYWLMTIALPKYLMFRYPAKLMIVGVLGIAVLAGLGMRNWPGNARRMTLAPLAIVIVSGILFAFRERLMADVDRRFSNDLFGPFQFEASLGIVGSAFISSLLLASVFLLLTVWGRRFRGGRRFIGLDLGWVLVLFVVGDLMHSNGHLKSEIDARFFVQEIELSENDRTGTIDSVAGNSEEINRFASSSSPERLAEVVTWYRTILFPRHHLPLRKRNPGSFSSLGLIDRVGVWLSQSEKWEEAATSNGWFHYQWTENEPKFRNRDFPEQVSDRNIANQLLVESYQCNRIELNVASGGSWLVMAEAWDPGWDGTISDSQTGTSEKVVIKRTDRGSFRYCWIPAGNWQFQMIYRPIEFRWGAWISSAGWIMLIIVVAVNSIRHQFTSDRFK